MSTQQTRNPAVAGKTTQAPSTHPDLQPFEDLADYARAYAREKPEVVAMVCLGIGFVVGWKLKPW